MAINYAISPHSCGAVITLRNLYIRLAHTNSFPLTTDHDVAAEDRRERERER